MTCKAELHIADDYGDNHATMKCQLDEGHEGPHTERFARNGEVIVTWLGDERESVEDRLAKDTGFDSTDAESD